MEIPDRLESLSNRYLLYKSEMFSDGPRRMVCNRHSFQVQGGFVCVRFIRVTTSEALHRRLGLAPCSKMLHQRNKEMLERGVYTEYARNTWNCHNVRIQWREYSYANCDIAV